MRMRMPWENYISSSGSAGGSSRAQGFSRAASSGTGSAAALSRQIRALTPGQTLRGEIVSRKGDEVQIRLSDDVVIQARVDQSMSLEVGKSMTFEVRNNARALTLSPLFTNMSADGNVSKAIDMAGLPLNETTVSMTRQMMEAGLPVDKASLQQMYREVCAFPQAQTLDIVNLHRLGLPVNQANVEQMTAYRSLTHQLTQGFDCLLEALPQAIEEMGVQGNEKELSGFYRELFALLLEEPAAAQTGELPPGQGEGAQESEGTDAGAVLGRPEPNALLGEMPLEGVPAQGEKAQKAAPQTQGESVFAAKAALSRELLEALDALPLSDEEKAAMGERLQQSARQEGSLQSFFSLSHELLLKSQDSPQGVAALHRIFAGKAFEELFKGQLQNLFFISPEEVGEPQKVEDLYRRLDRQLKGLSRALENGGQAESAAFRTAGALSRNLDFLHQINQMYAYVQLPLRMSQGEAHGELYVYTNKRSLAAEEGKITALLHLDMEHLGPVDVYVALEQSKVSTRFYVRDDEMLLFLEAHMETLTKRLAQRGYDCSFSMTVREKGQEPNSGVAPLLSSEKGLLVSQYAFDVRT